MAGFAISTEELLAAVFSRGFVPFTKDQFTRRFSSVGACWWSRDEPPGHGAGHYEGQHDGLQHLNARIRRDQARERGEEGTAGLREDEDKTCVERDSSSVSVFPKT